MWYEVKLTTQAIEQIQEIVRYISHILLVPETARKWADTLQSEIAKLRHVTLLQRKSLGVQKEYTK